MFVSLSVFFVCLYQDLYLEQRDKDEIEMAGAHQWECPSVPVHINI